MFVYWRARHSGVTKLKIGDVCWRGSGASETVLGVDNAKSGICYIYIYVCMYVWIVRMPFKRARGEHFSQKKHGVLGFIPVYSETTALSKPYFKLKP